MNDVLEGLIKSNVIEQIMFCIVLSIIKSFATSQQKTHDDILTSDHMIEHGEPKNIIYMCYPGGILAIYGQSTSCSS